MGKRTIPDIETKRLIVSLGLITFFFLIIIDIIVTSIGIQQGYVEAGLFSFSVEACVLNFCVFFSLAIFSIVCYKDIFLFKLISIGLVIIVTTRILVILNNIALLQR